DFALFEVIFRRNASPGLKELPDGLFRLRVMKEAPVEGSGGTSDGEVIGGRAEAAGDEDEVRAIKGLSEAVEDVVRFIADFAGVVETDPEAGQLVTEVDQVAIGAQPVEQFVPDGDQFRCSIDLHEALAMVEIPIL
ncbi:MAG: hypothetical protein RL648_669, partial [Verrucomicrobiota bacterium]